MKKLILTLLLCGVGSMALAADSSAGAVSKTDVQTPAAEAAEKPAKKMTRAEQKKAFEARAAVICARSRQAPRPTSSFPISQ